MYAMKTLYTATHHKHKVVWTDPECHDSFGQLQQLRDTARQTCSVKCMPYEAAPHHRQTHDQHLNRIQFKLKLKLKLKFPTNSDSHKLSTHYRNLFCFNTMTLFRAFVSVLHQIDNLFVNIF